MQGMREPRQSHHLTGAEKPWSEGGNRLKLKQMLWWEQLPERNSGRESGRDNETPRDLEVSFPRSRGVSSLELELAAVVRINLPSSLLLLSPIFLSLGSGNGGGSGIWSRSHVASAEWGWKCNLLSSAAACSKGQGLGEGSEGISGSWPPTPFLPQGESLSLPPLSPAPEQPELSMAGNLMVQESKSRVGVKKWSSHGFPGA